MGGGLRLTCARPHGADLRHLARRGDTRGRGGMEPACRPAACRDRGAFPLISAVASFLRVRLFEV